MRKTLSVVTCGLALVIALCSPAWCFLSWSWDLASGMPTLVAGGQPVVLSGTTNNSPSTTGNLSIVGDYFWIGFADPEAIGDPSQCFTHSLLSIPSISPGGQWSGGILSIAAAANTPATQYHAVLNLLGESSDGASMWGGPHDFYLNVIVPECSGLFTFITGIAGAFWLKSAKK